MFIIGAPRSGTTLLSLLLSNSPAIHCPPELWVALQGFNLLKKPFTKQDNDERDSYLSHLAVTESLPPAQLNELVNSFLVEFYNKVIKQKSSATLLIDKTPRYYKFIDKLEDMFPEAKFILVCRIPL